MEKIKQDYILIILNCYKYEYKRQLQIDTWLKDIPSQLKYFHIIGDKEKCGDKNFLFDTSNNILYTSTPDNYCSLPYKLITALNAIQNTYDYKCVFKTDDDQVLLRNGFFDILISSLNKKLHDYGGYVCDVKKSHISQYWRKHSSLPRNYLMKKTKYCNGRFYLLSKKSIMALLKNKYLFEKCPIEDHMVGFILTTKEKIVPHILPIDSNIFFQDIEDNIVLE